MYPLNIQIFPGSYERSSKFKEHDKVFTHPPPSVQNPKCHSMKSGWLKTGLLESSADRGCWTLLICFSYYFSGLNSECLCIQVPCFWVRSLTFIQSLLQQKNMLKGLKSWSRWKPTQNSGNSPTTDGMYWTTTIPPTNIDSKKWEFQDCLSNQDRYRDNWGCVPRSNDRYRQGLCELRKGDGNHKNSWPAKLGELEIFLYPQTYDWYAIEEKGGLPCKNYVFALNFH